MFGRRPDLPPGTFELLTDPDLLHDLDGTAFKVLVGLTQNARVMDQATWAVPPLVGGRGRLAKILGINVRTLASALDRLEEKNYILNTDKTSLGKDLGSVSGAIWLLWTAPLTEDGSPWRPDGGPSGPPDGRVKSSPVNLSQVKVSQVKDSPASAPASRGNLAPPRAQDVPHVHAYEEVHLNKHAHGGTSPPVRLLNALPCPDALDDGLTALGFHGHLTIPAGMTVEVETGDLHDVVSYLLGEQERARAEGRTLNAAGILGKRLKTAKELHGLLSQAGAQGYLARYRQATRSQESRPRWCGQCDQSTRLREHEISGQPYRCPECHPLNRVAEGA